ncbi:radical SAM protein [[Eubacterium] cellulosolvens]
MKISEMSSKTALSRSGIYGWVYALNPYRGCMHGCKYCYASNIIRQPRASWGTEVKVKKNIPTILSKELKRLTPALVGISSVTDPYQEIEKEYNITRYCLEQLLKFKFPISIITKSPLVIRDIELFKKFSYSEITITITTLDEQLSRILEPNAPSTTKRLEALTKLSAEGLNTYAFLGPLLPALEPDQVPEFINQIKSTGVKTIMVDTLNLKPGIWQDVEKALENLPATRDLFYRRLFQEPEYYPEIFNLIDSECIRHGINFEF